MGRTVWNSLQLEQHRSIGYSIKAHFWTSLIVRLEKSQNAGVYDFMMLFFANSSSTPAVSEQKFIAVHSKMKILLLITHTYVLPNP